jgi:ribosomal-protein-alanine N-acetyltransferase
MLAASCMDAIPETIATPRLHLRRPRLSDAAAIFEYVSDPEVTRFMDFPRHKTIDTVTEYLQRCVPMWESGEEFTWVMTLASSQELIGGISLRVRGHMADFGYVLGRGFWGQGLSAEAARAVVDVAASIKAVRRIWAACDAENLPAARVLEKAGLAREGVLRSYKVQPNISVNPRDALIYARICEP